MIPALFLAAFALFAGTAAPTVSYDDTGEFCVASLELGVPHPPGYPLYTLLMSLWRHLPVASLAGRLNLLAAACAAAAACLCYAWLRRDARVWAGPRAFLAWGLALFAVLAPGLWSQSGTAKGGVYALNAALVMGTVAAWTTPVLTTRAAMTAGIAAGLALANHWMTALGLVPGFVLLLLPTPGDPRAGRRAVLALLAAVMGCSLVLYLPLASTGLPFLNWGAPVTWRRLAFVLGRAQYTGFLAGESRLPLAERLVQLRGTLAVAGPATVAAALAALGAAVALRDMVRPAAAALIYVAVLDASLLAYGPLRAGAPWYLDIFAVPGTLLILGFAARGAGALLGRLPVRSAAVTGLLVLTGLSAAVLPGRRAVWDRSREYSTWDMALTLDRMAERPGLLLASSDAVIFGNWHLRLVEQRPGGLFAVPAPLLPMPWVAESFSRTIPYVRAPYPSPRIGAEAVPALMRAWADGNEGRFDIYTFETDASRAAFSASRLEVRGWLHRVRSVAAPQARTRSMPSFRWRAVRTRGWRDGELDREPRLKASIQPIAFSGLLTAIAAGGPPEDIPPALLAAKALALGRGDRSAVRLVEGNLAASRRAFGEAIRAFSEAAALDPPQPVALRNLAMVLLSAHRRAEALAVVRQLLREAPQSEEAREMRPLIGALEREGRVGHNTPP